MPCRTDGPKRRVMEFDEQWKTLTRHHNAVEKETEALREVVRRQQEIIQRVKALFPSIDLGRMPEIPEVTAPWKKTTFVLPNGSFMGGVIPHFDWLLEPSPAKEK